MTYLRNMYAARDGGGICTEPGCGRQYENGQDWVNHLAEEHGELYEAQRARIEERDNG